MTAYRFTDEEFVCVARRTGLSIVPKWCAAAADKEEDEAVVERLRKKDFLTEIDDLPHPALSLMFQQMRETSVWVIYGEDALLFSCEKMLILLERQDEERMRMIPFEGAAPCFLYLEEVSYLREGKILFAEDDQKARIAAQDLKKRLEAYFEQ